MGYSCGSNYKCKMTFEGLSKWWSNPRRRVNKIAHETQAMLSVDGSAFTICHYWTDIVRVLANGSVEILNAYPSQVTMGRINAILPSGHYMWTDSQSGA